MGQIQGVCVWGGGGGRGKEDGWGVGGGEGVSQLQHKRQTGPRRKAEQQKKLLPVQ